MSRVMRIMISSLVPSRSMHLTTSSKRMKSLSFRSTAPHAPRTSSTSKLGPLPPFLIPSRTREPTWSGPRTLCTMLSSVTGTPSTATISSPLLSRPQMCAEDPGMMIWICSGRRSGALEPCAMRMPTVECVPRRFTSSLSRSHPSSSSSAEIRFPIASRSGIGEASGVTVLSRRGDTGSSMRPERADCGVVLLMEPNPLPPPALSRSFSACLCRRSTSYTACSASL
mmetsp:Transcript_11460/g.28107  ORF Transcript_11460/g.28107 Transcript_11460/m.28107 type:complete len:226 (-) Transcript_11460:405-1082(-)